MKKWLIVCISIMLCVPFRGNAQSAYADKANKYIHEYSKLAIAEQKRRGVPAAVILGQGILETEAGCSILVTGANNHFGIKCRSDWKGETFSHTDDAENECFRKYKCGEDSYRDHSEYLRTSARYAALFRLPITDYSGWAYGLKKCGYATNPRYAQQLIKIIEDFHLEAYTYAAMNNTDMQGSDMASTSNSSDLVNNTRYVPEATTVASTTTVAPVAAGGKIKTQAGETITTLAPKKGQLLKVNGLRAFYALKGEMLLQYALKFNVRYEHLLEINDLKDAPLPVSMFVYLEKKNIRGQHATHIVKSGENMLVISQAEGIQLHRLMLLNKITIIGEEPVPGTLLQLQEQATAKPQVAYVYPPKEPIVTTRNRNSRIKVNSDVVANAVPVQAMNAATQVAPLAGTAMATTTPVRNASASIEETPVVTKEISNEQEAAYIAKEKQKADETAQPVAQMQEIKNVPDVATAPVKEVAKEEIPAVAQEVKLPTAAPAVAAATPAIVTTPVVISEPVAATTTSLEKTGKHEEEDYIAKAKEAEAAAPAPQQVAEAPVAVKEDPTTISVPVTETTTEVVTAPDVATTPVLQAPATDLKNAQPIVKEEVKAVDAPLTETPAAIEKATTPEVAIASVPVKDEIPAAAQASTIETPVAVNTQAVAQKELSEVAPAIIDATPKTETAAAPVVAEAPKEIAIAKTPQPVHIADAGNAIASTAAPVANVVAENAAVAAAPEEPQDEFSRLKSKLDKVVYASNDKKATTPAPTVAPSAPVAVEVPVANADAVPKAEIAKEIPAAKTEAKEDAAKFYTVKKGDTAFNIAKRHNITMRQLLNWNNLDFENIKTGQHLRVKE